MTGWLFTVKDGKRSAKRRESLKLWSEAPRDSKTGRLRRRSDGRPFAPKWGPGDKVVLYDPDGGDCYAMLDLRAHPRWENADEQWLVDAHVLAATQVGPSLTAIGVSKALQGGRHRLSMDQLAKAHRLLKAPGDPPDGTEGSPAPLDRLGREIQAVLREDLREGKKLMQPQYRGGGGEGSNGYCAVASAAYFFLGGGREAGLQPMQLTGPGFSHWWLRRSDGKVIDLTIDPSEAPSDFPYEKGGPKGFMQTGYKRPASRAKEVIKRVEKRRGS